MLPDKQTLNHSDTETPANVTDETKQPLEQNKHKHRTLYIKGLVGLVVILNLGLIGLNVHFYGHSGKEKLVNTFSKPIAKTLSPAETTKLKQKIPAGNEPTTLHYENPNKDFALDYPATWRIEGTNTRVDLTSAPFAYKLSDGTSHTGKVKVTISDNDSSSFFYFTESPTPTDSQSIKYSNPAPGQRAVTYLSTLNIGDSNLVGSFNLMVASGAHRYTVGSVINSQELSDVHPIIQAYVDTCQDHCQALSQGELTSILLKDDPTISQIPKIIASMRFN
jgi:hypothetical protein